MRHLARGNGFSVFQRFFVSVKALPVLYFLEELKREPLTEINKRIEEHTGRILYTHDHDGSLGIHGVLWTLTKIHRRLAWHAM